MLDSARRFIAVGELVMPTIAGLQLLPLLCPLPQLDPGVS